MPYCSGCDVRSQKPVREAGVAQHERVWNGCSTDFAGVDTVLGEHHNPSISIRAAPAGAAPGEAMTNEELFRELATRACCEALQESLQEKSRELADDVARKMGAALASQTAQPGPPEQRACCRQLRDGALLISNSRTQTETLESLLAASSSLTPACGLMIVRGAQASGWNCIGFAAPENFKGAVMDCARGAAATVLSSCAGRVARASELDPAFTARLGLESSAEVLLLPVVLKERVAALLLALSGSTDDLAGLELLVQVAQLALELQSHRKAVAQGAAEAPSAAELRRAVAEPAASRPEAAYAVEPESSGAEAAQPAPEPAPAYAAVTSSVPYSASFAASESGASTASGLASAGTSALDEAHERGRRFAKLLVEEIKLYNQAKVSEGRAHRDLYSRLREDIEKSRAAYQKRYGESVRDVDYFTQELMRILADNDRSLMGAGFPG